MAETGDLVEIKTDSETIKGVLLPEEKENVIIKLSSGYNIGINKDRIKKLTIIKKHKEIKVKKQKQLFNKQLPTISILHTGGTIASKIDYTTGAVIAKFTPEDLIDAVPELKDIANIKTKILSNIQSEMMRFVHYNLIAKEIEKEVKNRVDGIIITHGTDTMHYTAAALSFILEDLPVPVILVGSQRSSDRGSTDSAINLLSACLFITKTDFADVAICMHKSMDDNLCSILPATKTRKMHTSRRDTFKAINTTEIAEVNYKTKEIVFKTIYRKKQDTRLKLKLKLIKENLKIGLIKPHPNMYAQEISSYKNFDGLVIELMGIGHAPTSQVDKSTAENKRIKEAIKTLIKGGTLVVAAPQTIFGRINMNVYSPGRELIDIGVLGNYSDMTPETTFIKLAWLLSNHPNHVKELMTKNLRGEISSRITPEEFVE